MHSFTVICYGLGTEKYSTGNGLEISYVLVIISLPEVTKIYIGTSK